MKADFAKVIGNPRYKVIPREGVESVYSLGRTSGYREGVVIPREGVEMRIRLVDFKRSNFYLP